MVAAVVVTAIVVVVAAVTVVVLRQGLTLYSCLTGYLPCTSGWLQTHSNPEFQITGMGHYTQLAKYTLPASSSGTTSSFL